MPIAAGSLAALIGHVGADQPKGSLYRDTFTQFRVFATSIVHSSPCHLAESVG